jgi:hypothetical protein
LLFLVFGLKFKFDQLSTYNFKLTIIFVWLIRSESPE